MEKTLEKTEDKVQKICDALRRETLEPAKKEADRIITDAKERSEKILKEANAQAHHLHQQAKERIEQERNVFHSSLEQAGKQALEQIRQTIETKLFSNELQQLVDQSSSSPDVVAKLVNAIIHAIEKEGLSADLSAVIPSAVPTKEVNQKLGEGILKKLREGGVTLGDFAGGAQVKLHDKKMTIDITDTALKELISQYVRKDFRKLLFKL